MKIKLILTFFLIGCFLSSFAQDKPIPFLDSNTKLYGYKNSKGKKNIELIKPRFTDAYYFSGNYAIVKIKDKYGVINISGDEIIKIQYEDVRFIASGMVLAKLNSLYGIIDSTGKTVLDFKYSYINSELKFGKVVAKKEELYGLYSLQGNLILPHEYNDIYVLGKYYGLLKHDKYGLSNQKGNIILPFEYSYITTNEELIQVKKNYKYGCADSTGKIVIPIEFDEIGKLNSRKLYVKKTDKYGFYHVSGAKLTELKFDSAFNYGLFVARFYNNNGYGFVDSLGNEIASGFEQAEDCYYFSARIARNNKFGYIDISGKEIIAADYEYASPVNDFAPFVFLGKNHKYGIVNLDDESQNYLVELVYDSIVEQADLLMDKMQLIVKKNGKFGILQLFYENSLKTIHLNFEYEKIYFVRELYESNYEFYFILKKDGKYGMINYKMKTEIPLIYDELNIENENEYAEQTFIRIKKTGKYGLISKSGKSIVAPIYDSIRFYSELYNNAEISGFLVYTNGKYGLLNCYNGKELLPCIYDSIMPIYDELMRSFDKSIISYQGKYIQLYDYEFRPALPEKCEKIEFRINEIDYYNEGIVKLTVNGKFALWNIYNMKYSMDPIFDEIVAIPGVFSVLIVKINGKYGLKAMDSKTWKYPAEYDTFEIVNIDGVSKVRLLKADIGTEVEELE